MQQQVVAVSCGNLGDPAIWRVTANVASQTISCEPSAVTAERGFSFAFHPHLDLGYLVEFRARPNLIICQYDSNDWRAITRIALPQQINDACRIAVSPTGNHLAVAGYSSASVWQTKLDTRGTPTAGRVLHLVGSGTDKERQNHSYPHDVLFINDSLIVSDLGADEILWFDLDGVLLRRLELPLGFGPRHLQALDVETFVVSGELSSKLALITNGGDYITVFPSTGHVTGVAEHTNLIRNYPSNVIADVETATVYVANRGSGTIASFRVNGKQLEPLAETTVIGDWPEHLTLIPNGLIAAESDIAKLTLFERRKGGQLSEALTSCDLPKPVWEIGRAHV